MNNGTYHYKYDGNVQINLTTALCRCIILQAKDERVGLHI